MAITHPVASALEPKPKAIAAKIELFPVPFSPPMKLISAHDAPVSLVDGRPSLSWQARGCSKCARGTRTSSMDVGATEKSGVTDSRSGAITPTFDEIRGKIVVAHKV
jgi:hypothetical protein